MKSNLSPVDSCKKTSVASARRGVQSGAERSVCGCSCAQGMQWQSVSCNSAPTDP